MIEVTNIKGGFGYPQRVDGTNAWFSCEEGSEVCGMLWEAEDLVKEGGSFEGRIHHLIHFPEGAVHSPFALKKNVFVEEPFWDGAHMDFLAVDFNEKKIRVYQYAPETRKLTELTALPLDEDCDGYCLRASPLMLCRRVGASRWDVLWPEKRTYLLGENEGMMFRDGDDLYCSEWLEDPDYHENVIVRDYGTGAVKAQYRAYLVRMPNGDYWRCDGVKTPWRSHAGIVRIPGVSGYPERIEGTNEWFYCEEGEPFVSLSEIEETVGKFGRFPGRVGHLVRFPDGAVHSPFALRENLFIAPPVWNDGEIDFLAVDFGEKKIRVYQYAPETKELRELAALPLTGSCETLSLCVKPLMLCRNDAPNGFKILWPQPRAYETGKDESLMFRDGNDQYFAEEAWNPVFFQNVVVRDYETGAIREKYEGHLMRLADGVYWRL